jgi:uncharacterized protein (DUF1778 family)
MTSIQPANKRSAKSSRIGLRTTPEQEAVFRRAAEACQKSLTEFIIDSAYRAAEQALLDQRLFVVTGNRYQSFLELLDRPASDNEGLRDLFSKVAPWE